MLPDTPPWATPPEGAPTDDMIEARYVTDDGFFDPPIPAWDITDEGGAEWAMAKVKAAHEQIDAIHVKAQEWRTRLDEWVADTTRRPTSTLAYFVGRLTEYGLARRSAEPKTATFPLPSGVIRTRRNAAKAVVVDETAVIAWSKTVIGASTLGEPPNLLAHLVVKVTEKVRLAELREFVEIVDLLDGYTVTFADDSWQIVPVDWSDPADPSPDMSRLTVGQVRTVSSVEPRFTPTVVFRGAPVPGMAVDPETVTATVSSFPKELP